MFPLRLEVLDSSVFTRTSSAVDMDILAPILTVVGFAILVLRKSNVVVSFETGIVEEIY